MKIQKVVEFNKKSFWRSTIDTEALNAKIAELNRDGWQVVQINLARQWTGVLLLIERPA